MRRHRTQRVQPLLIPNQPRTGSLIPRFSVEPEIDPAGPLGEAPPRHALLERLGVEQPRRQAETRDREPHVPGGHHEDVRRPEPGQRGEHHHVGGHLRAGSYVADGVARVQADERVPHAHAAARRLVQRLARGDRVIDGVSSRLRDEHVEHVSAGEGVLEKSGKHLREPAVEPTLKHGRPGHHQRRLDHPLRRVEHLCAGGIVEPDGIKGVARAEERLHVQHGNHEFAHDEREERREQHPLGEEDAGAGLEEGEHPEQVQVLREAVKVPADELHAVARRDLEVELVSAVEGNLPRLANHLETEVLDPAPAEHEVHAAKDILGQVQLLGSLGHTAVPAHPGQVPDVGVPVVESHVQRLGHETLHDRPEDLLRERRERRDGSGSIGDHLLGETDEPGIPGELRQHVTKLQRLREVRVLVHVDCLHVHAGREGHAEVLVLGFTFADDGVAGESDPVRGYDTRGRAPRVERRPSMRHVPSYSSP